MPFLSDAPTGSFTVSMFEVDMISVGSEMSPFEIVFLRKGMFGRPEEPDEGGAWPGVKVEDTGVFAPDRGGVIFEAKGEGGTPRAEAGPGLYTFGDNVTGGPTPGDNRSREPVCKGCRPFESK